MRFYGFKAKELTSEAAPNLDLTLSLSNRVWFVLIIATALSFLPFRPISAPRWETSSRPVYGRLSFACWGFSALALLVLSAAALTNSNFHPFIYFRF